MFNQLVPQIPLIEAADFFHRIKYAGWDEPADMSGALEGQFAAPVEQVLAQLTKVITAKFRKVVAYYTYGESMRDLSQRGIRMIIFYEHAEDELKAVEYYLKRAAVLGGAIHLDPIEPPPASTDPIHIIETMIRAEQEAIAEQRQLRQLAGDENSLKVGIEEQLVKDQHHLDELWQLLPSDLHQGVEGDGAAVVETPGQADGAAVPSAPPAGPADGAKEPAKTAADKATPTDADLKETGRQRAVTQLSSEAHRERGRRGERFGETLGRVGGALGGAAAGHRLIGGRAGTVAGLAAGYAAGGKAGKEVGTEHDIRKNAAAMRFKLATTHLTPDETESVKAHRLATHLYVDPALGLVGAQVGSMLGHPYVGAAGGAGLGALLSHGLNRHLDKQVQRAQGGKLTPLERYGAKANAESSAAVPAMGVIGALQGASMGGTVPAAALMGLSGANLAHKGQAFNKTLLDVHERARGLGKEAAAMRFKLASIKLGFGPDLGTYMAANQAGQQAQQQSEADFYREKVRSMEQSSGATEQQIADMQMQLQQLQEQSASTGAAIQAASQEATMARDDALAQTQAAANMRIGYQKLRQMIIDAASQDPEAMAGGLPGDLPPGSGNGIAPAMQPGMPAASPEATAPGAVPAEAGGPGAPGDVQNAAGKPAAPAANAQPSSALKTAGAKTDAVKAVLKHPHAGAVAGGAVGAVTGAHHGVKHDTKGHPVRAGIAGGIKGTLVGGGIGEGTQRLVRNIRAL